MFIEDFFDSLWNEYTSMTPQALEIHKMLEARGEKVVNDHVAFRTINLDPIGLVTLQSHLFKIGYSRASYYHFKDKHLDAWSYINSDPKQPKIFLSAFNPDYLTATSREIVERKLDESDYDLVYKPEVLWGGPLWSPITHAEYEILAAESEYLAWVMVHGITPNHFTVSVNHLESINSLETMNACVAELKIRMNKAGGIIKGSQEALLEQSATMADQMPIEFGCSKIAWVPSCYYEFALRYKDDKGDLYQGFVTTSADKIFESTDSNNAQ